MKTKVWMNSYLTMTPIHKSSSNNPPTTSKSCHHLLIWFFQTLSSALIHNFICWYFSRKKNHLFAHTFFFPVNMSYYMGHPDEWDLQCYLCQKSKNQKITTLLTNYQQITNKLPKIWKHLGSHSSFSMTLPPSSLIIRIKTSFCSRTWERELWKESRTMMRMIIILNLRKTVVPVYQINRTCCADMVGLCTNPAREKIIAWL